MSSSLRSKTYYGHPDNDRTTGSNNEVIVQTTAGNMTDVSNNTSIASANGNGTNYSSFGHPYQHESSVSSTQVGFFLFLLGLFTSGIFLFLLKNRMHFANASNSRHQSTASQQQETVADDAANKALESMSSKERRHYIDSVLRVKVYKGHTDDEECPNISIEKADVESYGKSNIADHDKNDTELDVDTALEELSIDYDDSTSTNNPNDNSESAYDATNSTVPCCAICLEKFYIGDDISCSMDTTLCHHEYHTICITEWLMKHPNCPYCRRNYIPLPTPPPVTEAEDSSSAASTSIESPSATEMLSSFPTNIIHTAAIRATTATTTP